MINKKNLIETLEERLKNIEIGTCLDVRSYKRDRKILVVKQKIDELLVIEKGFQYRRYTIPSSALKKLMKVLIRHEFPRSNTIHIHAEKNWSEQMASKEELLGIRRRI